MNIKSTAFLSNKKHTNFFIVIYASIKKEINNRKRYLPSFIGEFVVVIVRILFFLLLSSFIKFKGNSDLTDIRLFIFFYCAIILLVFSNVTLYAPARTVTNDIYNGTLEYLFVTPVSIFNYFLGTVISNMIIISVIFVPLVTFLVIYINLSLINTLMVILICIVFIISLSSLGCLVAVLVLFWKRIDSILTIIMISFEILSGAYFPVEYMPNSIKYIAYILPYTWGYDLLRYYCYNGRWQTIESLWFEWIMLIGFMFINFIIAISLLKVVQKRIKNVGISII